MANNNEQNDGQADVSLKRPHDEGQKSISKKPKTGDPKVDDDSGKNPSGEDRDKRLAAVAAQRKRYSSIEEYLKPNVTPVKLPGKDAHVDDPRKKTYPPLILDGASGVGKTQQAFALLKGGKVQDPPKLVYILLSAGVYNTPTAQHIYQNLIDFTEAENQYSGKSIVLQHIDSVLKEQLKIAADNLSTTSISKLIQRAKDGEGNWRPMKDFVYFVWSRVLKYEKYDDSTGLLQKPNGKRQRPSFQDQLDDLKGTVLFLDEVLPSAFEKPISRDDRDRFNRDRLKFLQNFGRANFMRVVLAGTAATAAIMRTIPKPDNGRAGSRGEHANLTWGVVEYLYKTIDATVDLGTKQCTIRVRPLVKRWLESMPAGKYPTGIVGIIQFLRNQLDNTKRFSDESKFIWLSGACLCAKDTITSPFLLEPSALVRDHFFEPALLTYEEKRRGKLYERIYEGVGYKEISRQIGPQRLQIIKLQNRNDGIVWMLRREKKPLAIGPEYAFVEYALSNCVQICLAMEPLFAVAISLQNRFREYKEVKAFQKAFRHALPETSLQRRSGGVDGELHEQIVFAALQLASNQDIEKPTKVRDFVMKLNTLLWIDHKEENEKYNAIVKKLRKKRFLDAVSKKFTTAEFIPRCEKFEDLSGPPLSGELKTESEKMFERTVKIPWLVPACGMGELKHKIQAYGKDFFGELDIGGLVPGTGTSRMDAKVYRWNEELVHDDDGSTSDTDIEWMAFDDEEPKTSTNAVMAESKEDLAAGDEEPKNTTKSEDEPTNKELGLPTYWSIEFKARSCGYSMNAAKADLMKKCETDKECHGMLIGITNRADSECTYGVVKVNNKPYLRVVLLVGNRGQE